MIKHSRVSFAICLAALLLVLNGSVQAAQPHNPTQGQIVQYEFENNLNDALNSHHATFVANGEAGTPEYASLESSTALSLSPTEGFFLPAAVSQAIETSKGFELSLDFQVTDIGSGNGIKYLFTSADGPGIEAPGMVIEIRHDQFGEDENYQVFFSYNDDGSGDIPGHPGEHHETPIGDFTTSDIISLRLIVDFELMTWTTLLNSTFTNAKFEPNYNYDFIKATLNNNNLYFGWAENQEENMAEVPDIYTSSIIIDNLAITSPRRNGDTATLKAALVAMANHCNGNTSLSKDELSNHLSDIYVNYHSNYANAEMEILQFIQAYEDNYPPLFEDREPIQIGKLSPESRALLFVQQSMFDEVFVDGNMEEMAGMAYEFASIFPGAVNEAAETHTDAQVSIYGTYNRIEGARIAGDLEDAKRPTGYYAAPGALITVEIPDTLISAGLKVMVGAHTDDLSGLNEINRFVRVVKTIPLDSIETTIANPFGGGIYIKVPEGSNLGWFDVTISGAVKSAYFSARADQPNNLIEWQTELANAHVPWVDIESDKYMMTMPLSHIAEIDLIDPTQLMTIWDAMMDGFRYVGGRPPFRTRAEYFLVDSRLPGDAFGTGYPQVIGGGNAPYLPLSAQEYYPTHVLNDEFYISEFNTTLHEMGHGALHPTLFDEIESIIHLNATYIYNQVFDMSLDDGFKYSSDEFLTMDHTTLDWMITHNFRNNNDMGCDPTMDGLVCHEIRYQHRGHAKYIEMAGLFGWEAVHNMNKVFYDAWHATVNADTDVSKDDILLAASQANAVNMAPLFHFWGHAPSTSLNETLATLPSSPEIYNRLLHYFDLVPASQATFQPIYEILLVAKGEVHKARIDAANNNYETDGYAKQMQDQICSLIRTYYPDKSPAQCTSMADDEPTDDRTDDPTDTPVDEKPEQFSCANVTEIPQVECEALLATYDPDTHLRPGWLETATPCSWSGITCAEGHITELELAYNALNNLPAEIGNFTKLTKLNLNLSGLSSLPAEIGNLTNLTTLSIYNNKLSDLPAEIGNLTNLTELDLGANKLTSLPAEIGNLTNLTTFSLYSNQLSNLPGEIGNLTNLTKFNLESNDLTSLPAEIGNLASLTELLLMSNELINLPADFTKLTALTQLDIRFNNLTDIGAELKAFLDERDPDWADSQLDVCADINEIPSGECEVLKEIYDPAIGEPAGWLETTTPCSWSGVTCVDGHITELDLAVYQLSHMPAEIGDLINLTSLSFSGSQLSNLPAEIGNLTNLTKLDLSRNSVSNLPAEIGNLTSLTELDLSRNGLNSLPAEIGNLTNLTKLHLVYNQLSNLPVEIGNLTDLTELYLYNNQLSDLPAEIGNLTNLTELLVYLNELSSLPAEIGDLTNLTQLDLYSNKLSSLPAEIGDLTNLTELSLYMNQLSSLPAEIGDLTNLTGLYLSDNQLSSLPAEMENLTNLTKLNLASNQLDSLSDGIADLTSLTWLSLYSNQLSSLPAEIGDLTNLTALDLHSNQLSSLPDEITNLTDLTRLSLGYNQLVIPEDSLRSFVTGLDDNWAATQTIAPADVQATVVDQERVELTWTPIAFQDKEGYYEISIAEEDGTFTVHGTTTGKNVDSYMIDGLASGTTYDIRIRTYTPTHAGDNPDDRGDDQINPLWSDYTLVISATIPNLQTDDPTDEQTENNETENNETDTPVDQPVDEPTDGQTENNETDTPVDESNDSLTEGTEAEKVFVYLPVVAR